MKFKTHELNINSKHKKGIVIDEISHNNPYDFKQVHRHNYYEILLFSNENGGEQIIDFENYKIRKNIIYIIKPKQIHLMKNRVGENGFSIQFTEEFLKMNFSSLERIELLQNKTALSLTDFSYDELVNFSRKALFYFSNESILSHQKVINYIGLILTEILVTILKTQDCKHIKHNNISRNFMSLVKKEIRTTRNVQEYSDLLNISTNKLNNNIREGLGKSPKEIIQEYLLLEIKRLMVVNELSHKEISFYLNFDSQNSYNKFISKYTSQTPSKLKNSLIDFHK